MKRVDDDVKKREMFHEMVIDVSRDSRLLLQIHLNATGRGSIIRSSLFYLWILKSSPTL